MELWIARDTDGLIHLFVGNEPYKGKLYFTGDYSGYPLGKDAFPQVTWENSPQRVRIEIMEEGI